MNEYSRPSRRPRRREKKKKLDEEEETLGKKGHMLLLMRPNEVSDFDLCTLPSRIVKLEIK